MIHKKLIDTLNAQKKLSLEEWRTLLSDFDGADIAYAAEIAREISRSFWGNRLFFRGIIEFSNYCKNDCLYCGIRRSNKHAVRYRLELSQIMDCCREGYRLGYRSFVLQGGEDPYFEDARLCPIVEEISGAFPDAAITLSVGERSQDSYQRLFDAGARRYLLRHEAACPALYAATKRHAPRCMRSCIPPKCPWICACAP